MLPIHLILHQSALHLITYALVLSVLFASVWQAFTLSGLRRTLRSEAEQLQDGTVSIEGLLHPMARALQKLAAIPAWEKDLPRRVVEQAEAVLFLPLKAKVTLTRDLSTLMGLVATCAALVTAGADFAKNGRPELLVGSVASGTICTCIAAIGCMISLWNAHRLLHLRLRVRSDVEEWLLQPALIPGRANRANTLAAVDVDNPTALAMAQPEVFNDVT